MALTHQSHWDAHGTGTTTLAVSPVGVGNALVLCARVPTGFKLATVSGGGATGWTKIAQHDDGNRDVEAWIGTVSATGAATLTVTYSPSTPGAGTTELSVDEISTDIAGAHWAAVASGTNGATSATVSFPTLTVPTGSGEFGYIGGAWFANGPESGLTAGYTNEVTGTGNEIIYDLNLASGAQSPSFSQGSSGTFSAVGLILSAGNVYTASPTGTITLSGSVAEAKGFAESPTGTIALSGARVEAYAHADGPSGTITLSGTSTSTGGDSPSGTLTLSGSLAEASSASLSASGTITLSGTIVEKSFRYLVDLDPDTGKLYSVGAGLTALEPSVGLKPGAGLKPGGGKGAAVPLVPISADTGTLTKLD